MRGLAATALAVLAFVVLGGLSAADGTTPDSATRTPSVTRLGYVSPTAQSLLTQPVLDRYANDIQQRFAEAVSVSIVPMPTVRGASLASAAMCRLLHLSGFVEPHGHWQVTDAVLVIMDCNGNMFYRGDSARTDARDDSMPPQTQADALEEKAATELLRKFQAYQRAHGSAWDRLVRTGSMTDTTPSPGPTT